MDSVCDLGVIFCAGCSWTPRYGGLELELFLGLQFGDSNRISFGPSSRLERPCWSPSSSRHSPYLAVCILVMSSSRVMGAGRPSASQPPNARGSSAACVMASPAAVSIVAAASDAPPAHGVRAARGKAACLGRRSWPCAMRGPSPVGACVLIARTAVEGSSRCNWSDQCTPDAHDW